jgi:hypothetical protein
MQNTYILALSFLIGTANAALGSQILEVSVDTHTISGTTGSIDFQFNPGPLTHQSATVQIANFAGGAYGGSQQDFGGASGGPFPNPITLTNSGAFNDDFETFTFGSKLFFSLLFSGPAVDSPNGLSSSTSVFAFSIFSDVNGINPVLTNDPNGIAALVTVKLDGTLAKTAVSPQVTFVPEPGAFGLVGGAFAALVWIRRKHLLIRNQSVSR